MATFKGDVVRTRAGDAGEVIDVWGIAHTFIRIRREDGKSLPMLESEVVEVIKRKPSKSTRERR